MRAAAREALPGWIALLIVAALAWRRTLSDAAMMGDAPGTMGMPLVPFLEMWVPMMAAMMLPAIAPVATLWSRAIMRAPRAMERLARLALFATGYLVVWSAAGLAAFAVMRPIEQGLHAGCFTARTAAGAVFALAGLMNVAAMVALAVFIFAEKTTRFGVPAGRVAGVMMLVAAVAALVMR